ncbi:Rne/Rng family ribonuclease [Embleya sp. NPDC008237]|uniref:Rne/Rng family ribonuclease n=1 Tax=Embleya sp. NPDC008237 TaxID=3363978 RepID=UPI0036E690A7
MLDTEPNDTPETSGTPGVVNSGTSDNDNSTKDDTATTPAPRRRRAASRPAGPPSVPSAEAAPVQAAVTPEVPAPSDEEEPEAEEAAVAETTPEPQPEPEAPRRARRTRKRVTAPVTDTAEVASAPVEAAEPAPVAAEPEPEPEEAPRRVRRTRKRAAVAPEATPDEVVPEPAATSAQAEPAQPETEAEPAEEAPRRTRRTRKRAVPVEVTEETPIAEAEPVVPPEPEPEAVPEPRGRGGRKTPPPVFQPLFQAPQAAVFAAPQRAAEPTPAPAPAVAEPEPEARTESDEPRGRRRRRRALPVDEVHTAAEAEPQDSRYQDEQERHVDRSVAATEQPEPTEEPEGSEAHEDDTEGERPTRRRRRGGRRRRGRGDDGAEDNGSDEDGEQQAEGVGDGPDDDEDTDEPGDAGATTSSRRRRRRRRRDGAGDEPAAEPQDDPERTVVKVREPRKREALAESPTDEVQGVKGSTRLEAKKQRRREGREQGRRRVPIITESEFLARREAVERVMVVRQNGERTQIGVLEDDVLVEHYVSRSQDNQSAYVGNVYLGKVQNVLPSMEAAFVDIGKGRNAVLYAGEVNFEAAGFSGPRRIEAVLKPGQSVLVQVTKDPIGHKGARLTSQVSLPGRYLVYVPEGTMTGISRKLPDTERARLKTILKKIVPENAGVIVRTAAEGATEEDLTRDVTRLQAQWEEIKKKSKMITTSSPSLLYGEPDMTVRVIRDIFNEDFSKLIVSGDEAWDVIHDYVGHVAPDLAPRLSRWTSEVDVFATYRIDEQLMKALDRKVWLPSGGSLVIDRTEAMVVVDVNTGKFTGQGGNLEETVTRNNLEAAEEIVRQLRLRDLGGIIVVDFIDMVLEGNRDLVLRRLMECLGRDRTKHQVAEVTSLGLVQMTRKRVGQGLLEAFSENCERCNGRGVIVHMDAPETKGHGNGGHIHGGNGNGAPAGSGRRKRNKGNADKNGSGPITEIVDTDETVELDGPELEDVAVDTELPEVAALGSVEPVEVAEAIETVEAVEVAVEPEPAPPVEAEVTTEAPAEETPAEPVVEAEPEEAVEEAPAPAKRVRKAAAKKTVAKKAAAKTAPAKKTAAAKTPRKSAKKIAAEAAEAAAASEVPAEQPAAEPTPEPAPKAAGSTRAGRTAAKAKAAAEAPAEAEAEPAKPAKAAAKPRKTSRRATRPAGPPEGAVDGAEPVSAASGT